MTSARSLLLDVEGTTTPIAFVKDVLVPFARRNAASFLAAHRDDAEVRADLALLGAERAREVEAGAPDGPLPYLFWLMDRDRKSTALKTLQGRIWREGYESGALVAEVYPDVAPALARFGRGGVDVSIFSSGSVLAQRLLFAHTQDGDLRPFLRAYFDTTTGPKREAESYARIASALGRLPADVLFVSDVVEELDAAARAGLDVALCVRPGAPEPGTSRHRVVRSLGEI